MPTADDIANRLTNDRRVASVRDLLELARADDERAETLAASALDTVLGIGDPGTPTERGARAERMRDEARELADRARRLRALATELNSLGRLIGVPEVALVAAVGAHHERVSS